VKKFRLFTYATIVAIFACTISASAHAEELTSVGSVGIRIAQIPAEVADQPYSGTYIINRLHPGKPVTQRLEVFNTSSQKFEVNLYPGSASFNGGQFAVGEGRAGNDLTSWTKLSPDILMVMPGETKAFVMTISPPADAASVQQFGVIWAEVQGTPNAAGITSVSRVGIRMYLPVGNSPEISILESNLTSSTNEIIVKRSLISNYLMEVILTLIFVALFFLILLLFFRRLGTSDRKYQKENEKRLEAQWRRERDRRRHIWKHQSKRKQPRYIDDEYDEYHGEN
jgi:hypothetical protein